MLKTQTEIKLNTYTYLNPVDILLTDIRCAKNNHLQKLQPINQNNKHSIRKHLGKWLTKSFVLTI